MNGLGTLIIWVVLIGGTFIYLWRKGHLLRLSRYVAETREELRKCNWPTWEELKGSTVVIMITIFLFGAFIAGVDLGVSSVLDWVLKAV